VAAARRFNTRASNERDWLQYFRPGDPLSTGRFSIFVALVKRPVSPAAARASSNVPRIKLPRAPVRRTTNETYLRGRNRPRGPPDDGLAAEDPRMSRIAPFFDLASAIPRSNEFPSSPSNSIWTTRRALIKTRRSGATRTRTHLFVHLHV